MDPQGSQVVEPYKKQYGLTFPHLLDSKRLVSSAYRVRGTPTNFLLDRKGRVVAGAVGFRDFGSPEAHALIEALLGETAGKKNTTEPRSSQASPGG